MEDTTIEDVLKTVEAYHNQKDYGAALRVLESNQSQISPGVWHYNVGTLYGKLENWPLARFHLLKADWEGLSSEEVITNRNLVESKIEVDKLERPLVLADYLIKGSLGVSHGLLTAVSLILVLLGIINIWRKSSLKVIGLIFLLAIAIIGINFWILSWDKYIVIETQNIQEGPSGIFNTRDELPPGIMIVARKKDQWLEIVFPSRFQGWIKEAGLKELK